MHAARTIRRLARGPIRDGIRRRQLATAVLRGGRQGGPPDFVGIGVQRCGTSWWHSLIEAHPAVAPLGYGAKELHFFDPYWTRDFAAADIERYHAQFLRRPGQVVGEWTPRYLHDPWAVPLLMKAAPQTRLLLLLRDPVARFASGMQHAVKLGSGGTADAVTDTFGRGMYAGQLRRLFAVVPRAQVLVLQFERCVREPQVMLDATFEFLGLPSAPAAVSASRNASEWPIDLPQTLLDAVRCAYRTDVEQLPGIVPGCLDLDLWTGVNGGN